MNYSNNIIGRITPQEVVAILATTDPVALRLIRIAIGNTSEDLRIFTDNDAQITIYTDIYKWNDGVLHDGEPESQSTLSDDQEEELADNGGGWNTNTNTSGAV